jgi:hypothetical protein
VTAVAEAGVVQPKVDARSRGTLDKGTGGRGAADAAFKLVELKPPEKLILITLTSGTTFKVTWVANPPFQALPTPQQLPAGQYSCRVWPDGEIQVRTDFSIVLRPLSSVDPVLQRALALGTSGIPCVVTYGAATVAGAGRTPGTASSVQAPAAIPLRANLQALRDNARLRALMWEMLNHFAGAPAKPGDQVTLQDIEARMAAHPQSSEIVVRVTQGFTEYQQAGASDWATFERLTETLVEQFVFGNENFALNRFAIRSEPEGWGLYHRMNGIRFYDRLGMPVESFMGTLWDKHYRFVRRTPSSSRFGIAVSPDDPMFAIIEAFRAGGVPTPDQLEAAARGYFENADLLYKEFQKEPASFERLAQRLHDQFPMLAGFIFLEGLSSWMVIQPVPALRAVGYALRGLLAASKWAMQIQFAEDTVQVVLRIGASLYRVTPDAAGKLDAISQRHLTEAAKEARALIEMITELVMIILAFRVAEGIASIQPPSGPPRLQPAPATGRMAAGPAAGATATVTFPVSIPPGLVVASMNAREAFEKIKRRLEGKEREAAEREKKITDKAAREAAERARREADDDWRALEKLLREFLRDEPKVSGELRYENKQAKTILEDVLKEMEARAQDPLARQRVNEARTRFEQLKQQSIAQLMEENGLLRAFDKYRGYIERARVRAAARLRTADYARRNWDPGSPEYQLAYDELKYLEGLIRQLDTFRNGQVSTRILDGTQFFLEGRSANVIDATMRIGEIYHQMKSIVYRDLITRVLPDFKVDVFEFKSATANKVIEPTPNFAEKLEQAVDAKVAQEQ